MKRFNKKSAIQVFSAALILALSLGVQAKTLVGSRGSSRTYIKTADDGLSMRSLRKVGVGMSVAGASGFAGVDIEMNFTDAVSGSLGFGLGEGFQTLTFKIKKFVSSGSFLAYVAGGYSRWYTTSENGSMNKTNPEVLAQKFLSDKEKREGKFAENFLFPAAGIQYMQLDGEYAGTTIYAEVLMLVDIDDFVSAPAGGIGLQYFF